MVLLLESCVRSQSLVDASGKFSTLQPLEKPEE